METPTSFPTPETEPPKPISNYGCYKVLCENMFRYYSETYGLKGAVPRLMSATGGNTKKGIVFDMIRKLRTNPNELEIWVELRRKDGYMRFTEVLDTLKIPYTKFKGDLNKQLDKIFSDLFPVV